MPKYFFKYSVENRGREGDSNTWKIEDLDSGEVILTDHIEIKVPVSTVERHIEGKGFGMRCEGVISRRTHPKVGEFIVIEAE